MEGAEGVESAGILNGEAAQRTFLQVDRLDVLHSRHRALFVDAEHAEVGHDEWMVNDRSHNSVSRCMLDRSEAGSRHNL